MALGLAGQLELGDRRARMRRPRQAAHEAVFGPGPSYEHDRDHLTRIDDALAASARHRMNGQKTP